MCTDGLDTTVLIDLYVSVSNIHHVLILLKKRCPFSVKEFVIAAAHTAVENMKRVYPQVLHTSTF